MKAFLTGIVVSLVVMTPVFSPAYAAAPAYMRGIVVEVIAEDRMPLICEDEKYPCGSFPKGPLAGVRVYATQVKGGHKTYSKVTNKDGKVYFQKLKRGVYRVYVPSHAEKTVRVDKRKVKISLTLALH